MYRLVKITLNGLTKSKIQFSPIPREAVEEITDPDALSVYAYLMVKPANWDVRESDIMESRGLDKTRLAAAMLKLQQLGYITKDPQNRGILRLSMITKYRLEQMPEDYIDNWKPRRRATTNDEPPF